MNILETKTENNQYFGLYKIDLRSYWDNIYTGRQVLNAESFREYAEMRNSLKALNTRHRFEWINGGVYLPDYVWMADDTATFFKLKYGL